MSKIIVGLFKVMNRLQQRCAYRNYMGMKKKELRSRLSKVSNRKKLTDKQKKEIIDYYKRMTGMKISTLDHEYFYSRTGIYSKDYIPMSFFQSELIGRLNRMDLYDAYSDKNLDDVLLPGVKHPHYYLKNVNGYYYFEGRAVSRDEAVELCKNLGEDIIKPSSS